MGTLYGTGEIVELEEESKFESSFVKTGKTFYVKDDINRLFESIRIAAKRDHSQKKSMKRPMRLGPCHPSEPTSLKQALRGLSISQASEMAAMKKRLSKPRISGLLKSPQIAEAHEIKGHSDMVIVSLFPEKSTSNLHAQKLDIGGGTSVRELGQTRNLKLKLSSLSTRSKKKPPVSDEIIPTSVVELIQEKGHKPKLEPSSPSIFNSDKPISMNKVATTSATIKIHQFHKEPIDDLGPSTSDSGSKKPYPEDSLSSMDSSATKPKKGLKSRSREKGEFSQSSKSSIGEEHSSSTTSFSDESNVSRRGCRPHMSKDSRWEAIHSVQNQHGNLNLRHFKLIRKIGGGDIGTVYLAELIGSNCFFALKVLDMEFLALRNKATRAQTEREILQLLDHPFLPTLFGQFTNDKYSFLVIEYCPGGDLHVLRQKQPDKCLSEKAARFYVAEVLLALEYLHMLGIVYRDLKPENILVREDGHIMLTDFDLSLRCVPNPTLVKPASPATVDRPKTADSSCIDPFCLQPAWQVPCFTPRFPSTLPKSQKVKSDPIAQVSPLPQLVVEPTGARSNSFVGTHEYLAPEIVNGEGHGSQVDWWTFGVLLYELLYGRTPFKGTGNEETLANIVSRGVEFPDGGGSSNARDLIRGLLRKRPEKRLGSVEGAAEIRRHPFFEGMNWALIRCATPPEKPGMQDPATEKWDLEKGRGEKVVFGMF